MAGKSGKRKVSEYSSAETQMNFSINTPSIPFDKPKKSKEKSDDEDTYKKSKFRSILVKKAPRTSKERYVYLEIMLRHRKRGSSGASTLMTSFVT